MSGVKGIILAGGAGTRLYPATIAVSKQLLPVYDKPMIYYPLSVLVRAGIREIMVITTPRDAPAFRTLLGDGGQWGLRFELAVQAVPDGLPQAFILSERFLDGDGAVLILGDNLFHGAGFEEMVRRAAEAGTGETVFCYEVSDPGRYGVAALADDGRVLEVAEKPARPASRWAITGLYVVDGRACEIASGLVKSKRGEYEIVDVHKKYLESATLRAVRLGPGFAWLDMGTHDSLVEASEFVRVIERRQGQKIGCVEEAAYRSGFIDGKRLMRLAADVGGAYGDYLRQVAGRRVIASASHALDRIRAAP